jgi:hypothetical protein
MYTEWSRIYLNNGRQFCEKMLVYHVIPRSMGKIEKYVSPKLTDYFIHGVRKWYASPKLTDYIIHGVRKYATPKLTDYFIHGVRKYAAPKLTDNFIHGWENMFHLN